MVGCYTDDSEPLLIEGERICIHAQVVIVRLVLHGEPEKSELDLWAAWRAGRAESMNSDVKVCTHPERPIHQRLVAAFSELALCL